MTPVLVSAAAVFVTEPGVLAAAADAAAAAAVGGMFLYWWVYVYMMFLMLECCHLGRYPCLVPETLLPNDDMHKCFY
jgi:hypothetical protein